MFCFHCFFLPPAGNVLLPTEKVPGCFISAFCWNVRTVLFRD